MSMGNFKRENPSNWKDIAADQYKLSHPYDESKNTLVEYTPLQVLPPLLEGGL